jgi:hypothetical protein
VLALDNFQARLNNREKSRPKDPALYLLNNA